MTKPKVAFICVHNSCRSQIAEALGKALASDVFESYSAGTETKPRINQDAVRLVNELYGININHKEVHRMLLNEIINEVGMTKRAVKYYEEKGLLSVDKDNNGYRNYTAQDVETLKKISVYRKLGISIKDMEM